MAKSNSRKRHSYPRSSPKNAYIAKQRARDDVLQDASRQTFEQYTWDCLCIALHDKAVMGKDTFGAGRITRLHMAWRGIYLKFLPTLVNSDETDAYRVIFDEQLQKILKDRFAPFGDRYEWLPETTEAKNLHTRPDGGERPDGS